jgi:hypothetical protein
MSSYSLLRPTAWAVALSLLASACSETTPSAPEIADLPDLRRERLPERVIEELLKLRESLVQYQSFDLAMDAGFDTKLTDCMETRSLGGMGYHYGNGLIIDAIPDPQAPEVLLYQPVKGGGRQLVGVEFIVPFTAWTETDPPVLYGQVMRPNNVFGLWTLHVWLFEFNPRGLFADHNPRVRC